MVGHAGSHTVHADMTLIWSKVKSRSLRFWSSENCTFVRLSPPPFWRGTQNWWLITIVWDLVYSFSAFRSQIS